MSADDSTDLSSSGTFTLRPITPLITTTTATDIQMKSSSVSDLSATSKETTSHASLPSTKSTAGSRFYRSRSLHGCGPTRQSSIEGGSRRKIGIVIGDFTRMYPDELTLTLGERIEIISKHVDVSRNIGWWTARNSQGEMGLVPVSCVKVVTTSVSSESDVPLQPSAASIGGATSLSADTTTIAAAMMLTEAMTYPIEIQPEDIRLLEVIGVGGFGRVHKAVYKGVEVAVKVARHTNYDIVKIINEVLTEAEKFAKLAHENVCALVGVSLVRDVYLVMEYAKGGSLSQVIHERGVVIPIDVVLDWALQISDGMKYLHHEVHPSLIHRDLKSSNS